MFDKQSSTFSCIIIRFLINMPVQGQNPHQWAPFQTAGLLHAWQILHHISRYVHHEGCRELPLSAIPLYQLFPCHLGPPRHTLSISLYVKGCLDCTIGAFHVHSISLLSLRSRFSMPSHTRSSLGLVVTMSYGLTLQICLIIALSFHCRRWRFGFVNGQVSLAWSIALRTQDL